MGVAEFVTAARHASGDCRRDDQRKSAWIFLAAALARPELALTFPVLLDMEGSAQRAFHVRGLPSSYFINRRGMVQTTYLGAMTPEFIEARIGEISTP